MNEAFLIVQTLCPAAIIITFGVAVLLRLPERKNYQSCPPAQSRIKPTTKGEKKHVIQKEIE